MNTMGTIAWGAQRGGGRLSFHERWKMTAQMIAAVLRARMSRRSASPIAPDLERPNTAVARRAETLLGETSPPWLVNHGFRTYAWAIAFAARDDLRPDREVLYCAGLLHDLGLVAPFLPAPGRCFALSGAAAAEDTLRAAGMDPARAIRVAEAIALHLNLQVELAKNGVEAHLLRAAAALDVVGQGATALPRAFRDRVLSEIPRLDFKRELAVTLAAQAERSPGTRIGHLCRMGLIQRAQTAPFPS